MSRMEHKDVELKEIQLESSVMYSGDFIEVHKDIVRLPDGSIGSREYITHPGAVAVLAMHDNGKLVMERQFRYAPHHLFVETEGLIRRAPE